MILVHVTTVPETFGFFGGQIAYLKNKGFEVHAVSSAGALLDELGVREDIPVHAVEMPRRIAPMSDLVAVYKLYRLFRQLRPTIVHAHTPKGGLLGVMAARLARVPVVIYSIFGLPFVTALGFKRKLLCWTETLSCRMADQVIAIGFSVQKRALAAGICSKDKMRVLANGSFFGVDAAVKFNPQNLRRGIREEIRIRNQIPADSLILGFMGRIVRDKGIIELERAWQIIRNQYPNLYLILVGEDEPQDPVPAEVLKRLREDPKVCFTGWVEDAVPLLAAMDLLALPTYREGFGSSILEASAMQLPVVATRVDGCVESVAEGMTGILVPPKDASALAGAIQQLLENPLLRRQMGQAGRQRVISLFKPEISWQALYKCYSELIGFQVFQ